MSRGLGVHSVICILRLNPSYASRGCSHSVIVAMVILSRRLAVMSTLTSSGKLRHSFGFICYHQISDPHLS